MFGDFFPETSAAGIMWKNAVQPDRQQMKIWSICIARLITKPSYTHSEYVTLIAYTLP